MADKKNTDQERWDAIGAWYRQNQQTATTNFGGGVLVSPGGALVDQYKVRDFFKDIIAYPEEYKFYSNILKRKGYQYDFRGIAGMADYAIDYAARNRHLGATVTDFFKILPNLNEDGGDGAGGPSSWYREDVALANRGDAATILDNAYQQNLGRKASNEEIKAFYQALKELQQGNPNISQGTSNVSGDMQTTSATSKGGFNAQRFAEEWAMSRPEYAESFAATNIMSVVEAMINRGPSLGGNA